MRKFGKELISKCQIDEKEFNKFTISDSLKFKKRVFHLNLFKFLILE